MSVTAKGALTREQAAYLARRASEVKMPTHEEEKSARARVGEDQAARLAWFLDFAHRPLDQIRSMDNESLRQLNAEVREFGKGLQEGSGSQTPRIGETIRNEICELATFANKSVYEFLSTDTVSFAPFWLEKPGERTLAIRVDRRGSKVIGSLSGSIPQMFVMKTSEVFLAEAWRLTKCASEGCGRVFVKRKRGEYCSGRCSLRERMRRYRKNLTPKDRYEIRNAQYVKSVARVDSKRVVRPQGPRRTK